MLKKKINIFDNKTRIQIQIKNKLEELRSNSKKFLNQNEKYYKIGYNSSIKRKQCAQKGSCDVIDEKCKKQQISN